MRAFIVYTRGLWEVESDGEKILAKNGNRVLNINFSDIDYIRIARTYKSSKFRRMKVFLKHDINRVSEFRIIARIDGYEETYLLDPFVAQGGKTTTNFFEEI